MGWKSVAWCACLVPVLTGCGALRHAGSRSSGDAERVALSGAGAPAQAQWARPAQPSSKGAPGAPVAERRPPVPEVRETLVPPLPKPELPVIKPFDPPLPSEANVKFVPGAPLPDPDRLPVPYPPLAVPAARPAEPAPVAPPLAIPTVLDTIPPIPFQLPPAPPR